MIKGFEEYTCELTDKQVETAREVYKVLMWHRNRCWLKSHEIAERVGKKISGPVMRKMIAHCRVMLAQKVDNFSDDQKMPCLIATSKGYKMSTCLKEIEDYQVSIAQRLSQISLIATANNVMYSRLRRQARLEGQMALKEVAD